MAQSKEAYALALHSNMVHLNKPPHCGDTAFTEKSGGCKDEVSEREITPTYKPAITSMGTWVGEEKQVMLSPSRINSAISMGKGSIWV